MFIVFTALLLLMVLVVGMIVGASSIRLSQVFNVLIGFGDKVDRQIILNIRLPRILSGMLAGTALAVSGTIMQSILRNPLGSPFTLGISNAAAFGAAFAIIILGAGSTQNSINNVVTLNNPYIITLSAFFWSLVSTFIILIIAKFKDAMPETLILTGIILGSLFIAGTTALEYFAEEVQLASIVFWTFGDLGRASWNEFYILLAVIIPSLTFFIYNRLNISVMSSGDETANSLGVNVERLRVRMMLVASLTTAVSVSFFGIIAFVGLVVPHIVRRLTGNDERFLIPASALFGGVFLLISDILARTIISPIVLPVGILTSFIGAPLFIYLLIKGRKGGMWTK
jgi:iron complex transport system permease protein